MNNTVSLKVPSKSEYIIVTRLCASGIAGRMGFNLDQIEDIKLAVSEAGNLLIQQPCIFPELNLIFTIESAQLMVEVNAEGLEDPECGREIGEFNELTLAIIESMTDSMEQLYVNGVLSGIKMTILIGGNTIA